MKIKPFIIGIAGGTGSGKTTVSKKIVKHFGSDIIYLQHDSYYRDHSDLSFEERQKINYDHPDSLETELLIKHIYTLQSGKSISVPVYDFTQHNRTKQTILIRPKKIIIVEGILVFADESLKKLMDLKIFIDTDADIRLGRRIVRDIHERGRTLEFSLHQYLTQSKPMHEAFVEPSKRYADLIIPEGGNNSVAIRTLIHTIEQMLKSS